MDATVTAIVPLKSLGEAKQRLAGTLTPGERRRLSAWMFARVADACVQAAHVRRVLVVAGDRDAAALAERVGLDVLMEPAPGLARALAAADDALAGEDATLVLVADLPLVGADDVDAVCASADRAQVVVAPTHDGGTGALLRRPAGVIATAFGPGSAARHLASAHAAGLHAVRIDRLGLASDVDTPAQLRATACWPSAGGGRTLSR